MERWMPLAEEDPVPGDPWALQALASHLRERGGVIHDVLDQLRRIDHSEYWDSPAAAGFAASRDALLPDLELLANRYQRTDRALGRYCPALDDAQDLAERARLKARAAQAEIDRARSALARKAQETALKPLDLAEMPVWAPADPDQVVLEEGEAQLRIARNLLDDARELRDEAARRCGVAIGEALDDGLRNDAGLSGVIKGWADSLVDHFPYVDDIARVAGLASGALGLLALIPPLAPVLAPAAAVAGGISLLANSTLAAAGEQSWREAGLDAVGLATFGIGRIATAGSRMLAGRDLAKGAAQLKALRLRMSGARFAQFERLTPLGTTRLLSTARHLKEASGIFGRAARPFLDAAGRPVRAWAMLRSSAAFWHHAELPGRAILAVSGGGARFLAGASRSATGVGAGLDARDVYNEPLIKHRFETLPEGQGGSVIRDGG